MDASLPVQALLGLYLGALTAVVPALVAWTLGFTFKYVTGVTIPGFGVLVLGVAIAGVQGGLLGLLDAQILGSPTALVSALVVMMVTLYAHAQGDRMGAEFPHRITLRTLRDRGLSADAIERVGQFGQVRVRTTGDVGDVEGYPPLPDALRATIRDGEWTFPADLPLSELETRLEERLRTDHDLAAVAASIDDRGRATISAAPPVGALSRRVPTGERAVSVEALVPTGVARGDEATVATGDEAVTGTVLSARTDADGSPPASAAPADADDAEGSADRPLPTAGAAPRTTGGDGRITLGVPARDAPALLAADRAAVRVHARGTRGEFELLALLRRDGKRLREVRVGRPGSLDGMRPAAGFGGAGETAPEETEEPPHEVAVLAIRRGDSWTFAPRGTTGLDAGDQLYAVGSPGALDRFEAVVA
ncbi:TrkA C-terminal domain-containing protein [Halorussus marinus]|uniref:TrkA C-terminal domain-containing protein n=1 Tax=Halorussus marinus TaxID=2505976 RepID=UPI001092561E|nr:TrkA C-terminal domain-containing protein [Halorussus marinus]